MNAPFQVRSLSCLGGRSTPNFAKRIFHALPVDVIIKYLTFKGMKTKDGFCSPKLYEVITRHLVSDFMIIYHTDIYPQWTKVSRPDVYDA